MGGLAGKRIVNTRATHQAEVLNVLLRERGAVPLNYPCIAISPPDDPSLLDAALVNLAAGRYEWLVLTSVNTVLVIAERLAALGLTLDEGTFQTAAVGPATAEAIQDHLGLSIADLPAEYVAESLAQHVALKTAERVLLPESALARPTLANQLTAREADVTVVTAYQTICGTGGADIPHLLIQGQVDLLTFTSSSTVTYFLERLKAEGGWAETAYVIPAVCIGPKTAATAQECGFSMIYTPTEHTLEGLVAMLDTDLIERQS